MIFTKRDLLPEGEVIPDLHAPEAAMPLEISSAAGTGLEDLKERLWDFIGAVRAAEPEQDADVEEADAEHPADDLFEPDDDLLES